MIRIGLSDNLNVCRKCKTTQPFNKFVKKSGNKNGYLSICKSYHNLEMKVYYENHKETILKTNRAYKINNPEKYKEIRQKIEQKYQTTPKHFYKRMKANSKNKNRKFKMSQVEFFDWYNLQEQKCCYCSIPTEKLYLLPRVGKNIIKRLTIDRIDNSKPYEIGNILLACHICNTMKLNYLNLEDMKVIGQKYLKPKWRNLDKSRRNL